jgi:hypothetical protein
MLGGICDCLDVDVVAVVIVVVMIVTTTTITTVTTITAMVMVVNIPIAGIFSVRGGFLCTIIAYIFRR